MKVETMLINGVSKDIKIMNRDILTTHQEKEQRIRDYCTKLEFIHNQCEDDRIRKDREDAAAAARNQEQVFQTEETIEVLAKATYNPIELESTSEEVKIVKRRTYPQHQPQQFFNHNVNPNQQLIGVPNNGTYQL